MDTLFGTYGGFGWPLAFDRPLTDRAQNLYSRGDRWGVGYLMELNGAWHVVTPVVDQIPPLPIIEDPPDGGGGEDEDPPITPDPREGDEEKTGPPPDERDQVPGPSGLPKRPGDGEVPACDEIGLPPTPIPGTPGQPPIGIPEGTERGITAGFKPLLFSVGLVSTAPGTSGARKSPGAGKTLIQPRPLTTQPGKFDVRQRLGGGPYMRSAPLVPRGGVRVIDARDFTPDHNVWDFANYLIDKVNQLTSLVNARFPFAPDVVRGAGLHLPTQDAAKIRIDQFDSGSLLMAGVEDRGGRKWPVPPLVGRGAKGKALTRISPHAIPERTHGAGKRGEDIVTRYDTGEAGKLKGTDKRGDGQPKIGWDGKRKVLLVEGALLEVREDLTLVEEDGTEVKVGKAASEAYAVPRADSAGDIADGWLSSNVPLLNGENVWTGVNDFDGGTLQVERFTGSVPALASGEFGLATDVSRLYIGV